MRAANEGGFRPLKFKFLPPFGGTFGLNNNIFNIIFEEGKSSAEWKLRFYLLLRNPKFSKDLEQTHQNLGIKKS